MACVDLDVFPSEGSRSSDGDVSISPVEDRVSVSLVNSGNNDQTDMAIDMASMACVDLDVFPSEGSRSSDGDGSISPVEKDRVSVSSVNSGDNDQTDMAIEVSQFQPLNHPESPVICSLWWSHRIMRHQLCP